MNDLTASEIALIQRRRAERAQRDAARAFQRQAISTAHAFDDWSDKTGEGLTFSTFINTFGFQGDNGKQMYEAVKRILDAAWPLVTTPAAPTKGRIEDEAPQYQQCPTCGSWICYCGRDNRVD